ncbi:MAG: DUF4097 family beta strand repeat-containing protein [Coriobacteriales bacterium]|nr:DUF4097 family beta strand repeat-containing protein [Coriobacteriales bacterium]
MTYRDNSPDVRPTSGRRWILWLAAIAVILVFLAALVRVAFHAFVAINPSLTGDADQTKTLFVQLDPFYVPADGVTQFEVYGGSSNVIIQPYHDNERKGFVRITEGYLDDGSDRRHLFWTVENGTLRIDDNEYGLAITSGKMVTIELPSDIIASLESADLTCSSGTLTVDGLDCEVLTLRVASGSADVVVQGEPEHIACDVQSGQARIALPHDLGFTPNVQEASGKVTIEQRLNDVDGVAVYGDGYTKLDLTVASGRIDISAL